MKKILFVASEGVPFIKTGGLADVVGALPKCIDREYYDVRVILPKYVCMTQAMKDRLTYRTHFYMDFHWQYEGIIGCVINDPLAAAYLIDPSMCSGFDSFLEVETEGICRGQTVVDSMNFWKKKPNSHVLTETDAKRFTSFFLSRILKKEDGTGWKPEELTCLEEL